MATPKTPPAGCKKQNRDLKNNTPFLCMGTGKLALHVAVRKAKLPLTQREKIMVAYWAEWLRHYHV